jgi:glucokinase
VADETSNELQRAVGIGELQRTVERNHKDLVVALEVLGQRMERYVLEKVYVAQYEALADKVKRIDEDAEEDRKTARAAEASNHQTSRMAFLTSLGAFLGALALAALTGWLRTGGH